MHDEQMESAVRQIRSLCAELAERRGLKPEVREELCAHMEDKLLGYLKGEERVSVEDALVLVRAHFGDVERVGRELAREGSGAGERFLSARIDHRRLYAALLVVAGVATTLSIPLGLFIYTLRQLGLSGFGVPGHVPTWFLPWASLISAGYVGLILVTLTARQLNPVAGRRLTRVLNYALLLAPPFGTVVGIYGLLKVDRHEARAGIAATR